MRWWEVKEEVMVMEWKSCRWLVKLDGDDRWGHSEKEGYELLLYTTWRMCTTAKWVTEQGNGTIQYDRVNMVIFQYTFICSPCWLHYLSQEHTNHLSNPLDILWFLQSGFYGSLFVFSLYWVAAIINFLTKHTNAQFQMSDLEWIWDRFRVTLWRKSHNDFLPKLLPRPFLVNIL